MTNHSLRRVLIYFSSSFFEKYCFGFVNFTLVGQWKRIFDKFLYWKRTAEYLNLIQSSLILLLFQSLFTLLLFLKFLNRLPLCQCVFGQQMHIIMEWNNLECVFIISAFVEPIFGKPVCLSVVFSRHLLSKMKGEWSAPYYRGHFLTLTLIFRGSYFADPDTIHLSIYYFRHCHSNLERKCCNFAGLSEG